MVATAVYNFLQVLFYYACHLRLPHQPFIINTRTRCKVINTHRDHYGLNRFQLLSKKLFLRKKTKKTRI